MKKKLKIGIDIDDVVSQTSRLYVSRYNREFGTNVVYEKMTDYYQMDKNPDIPPEKIEEFFEEIVGTTDFQHALPPYADVSDIVNKWSKKGYIVHYITARPLSWKNLTCSWLEKHGLWVTHARLDLHDRKSNMSGAEFKAQTVKRFKIDLMIEDYQEYVKDMKIPVLLIDRPWNRGELPKHVHRVNNWQEIDEYVERLEQ